MTTPLNPSSVSLFKRIPVSELKLIIRRVINSAVTLFVIAYLTSFLLILAERGRDHIPANPLNAATQSFVRIWQYVFEHPQTYHWLKADIPSSELILVTLGKSAGLLAISLGIAFIIGLGLGTAAAVSKRKVFSSFIIMLSTLGVSIPSFLLAMLFWVLNIQVHRTFGIEVLPSVGFGWDAHLVMPVLILAMRPLAQITQVTYITLTDIFTQDYIRTANSKGMKARRVFTHHILINALIPILTTLGASLRFSLASLPIVELFFSWPGIGLTLLQAVAKGMSILVMDLILSLGMFFLFVNLIIEVLFPLIDARRRSTESQTGRQETSSFINSIKAFRHALSDWVSSLPGIFRRPVSQLPPLPIVVKRSESFEKLPVDKKRFGPAIYKNPSLILGFIIILGLLFLAIWGGNLTSANPYTTHTILSIEGVVQSPPFKPSPTFPWGSDYIGRDMQALVINGARQTLTLALFGMVVRVLLGSFLGTLAGWKQGSRLDRFISGAVGVWAAFPVTLFAMLLIQALGIQQGLWVFVVALSVVGWGEVAQIVRNQVISIKLQPYIESARSVGAGPLQILIRQVLPNLVNDLIVMASLEMGGIMMLLAELGYLSIFLGGGFKAMIGEIGRLEPLVVFYSDVPEWSAIIANVRDYWRSYPWMALYAGLAFFISIMAFNLMGEGLRRFLVESRANLSRLFNRYTLLAGTTIVVIITLMLQANTPLGLYKSVGLQFEPQRVQQEIAVLLSPEFQGRETGTPGAEFAAQYIAGRMEEIGLMPAGEKHTFFQTQPNPRQHLLNLPTLSIEGSSQPLVYRRDFAEIANHYGNVQDAIVGVAFGPASYDVSQTDPYGLMNTESIDHILVIRGEDYEKISGGYGIGILVIEDEQHSIDRKDLALYQAPRADSARRVPVMVITREVADQLLATAGSSIADLEQRASLMGVNQASLTETGSSVHMDVNAQFPEDITSEKYINVLGVIPGEGHFMGTEDHVIIVSAYYDGLGTGPDGTIYPGANDNASGVAMLLEIARVLNATIYKPEKTIIFAAWAGGERGDGLSVVNVMNARPGAGDFIVEAVIELSGVGYGLGNAIALDEISSYRLVKLFQEAAGKFNDPTTTRGTNPHYQNGPAVGFGNRTALTLSLSWDGSNAFAHTPGDVGSIIDPQKLMSIGRSTVLTLMVLCRETNY